MPDWFWFIAALLVLLGYGYYHWQQRRQRRDEYADLADRLGWEYSPNDNSLVAHYPGDPFKWGHWRKAEHVFRGNYRRRRLTAFEYSFRMEETDRNGDERTDRNFYQILAVEIPAAKPFLETGPRGIFSRIARSVGWPTVETGDARFDQEFELKTDESSFATRLLNDDVRAWLLRDPRARDNPIRICRNEILTWRQGALEVHDLEHRADFLCDFIEQTPQLRKPTA